MRIFCLLLGVLLPVSLASGRDAADVAAVRRDDPELVLRTFLKALADNKLRAAYELIDPDTQELGDPIAYRTPVDYENFVREVGRCGKTFTNYRMGDRRTERDGVVRIWISFGGDNDETMLVCRNGLWFVADPIHIIR